jgi:hypothetical protein
MSFPPVLSPMSLPTFKQMLLSLRHYRSRVRLNILKTIPMGIGYGLWSGVGIILITVVGWYFYQQQLDLAALIGIGFICVGVVIIQIFSKSVTH